MGPVLAPTVAQAPEKPAVPTLANGASLPLYPGASTIHSPEALWATTYCVVNVASGAETSVLELARLIRDLISPDKEIRCRGRARRGDPPAWRADISRLQARAPNWQPQALTSALAECVAVWQQESKSVSN